MKLTVLVENNTYIDEYYYGEPGVSFYIEEGDTKVLFDLGYSDIFLKNAKEMGIDLSQVKTVVLSHGHDDHTGGLPHLMKAFDLSGVQLIAHPFALMKKVYHDESIGSPAGQDTLEGLCKVTLSKRPVKITDKLIFLGEIPQLNHFETRRAIGKILSPDGWREDMVYDDSSLVYRGEEGLYIITGCAHSGICNTIEYAKRVCGEERIAGVIGGFHLFHVDERVQQTIQYLMENDIPYLYPCHCVSLYVKGEMLKQMDIGEVGVGLTLDWK